MPKQNGWMDKLKKEIGERERERGGKQRTSSRNNEKENSKYVRAHSAKKNKRVGQRDSR